MNLNELESKATRILDENNTEEANRNLELFDSLKEQEITNNGTDVGITAGCYNGTGPVGDCTIINSQVQRYVESKTYLYSEWGVGLYCVVDVCVPIPKEVDICRIVYQQHVRYQYDCWFQGCNTKRYWGDWTYVTNYMSTDLDCDSLPDVGQWF